MPRGTHHDLTGLLLGEWPKLILRVPGGGEWRLDIARRHERLCGQRVRVQGVRDGFDLLAVERIEPA